MKWRSSAKIVLQWHGKCCSNDPLGHNIHTIDGKHPFWSAFGMDFLCMLQRLKICMPIMVMGNLYLWNEINDNLSLSQTKNQRIDLYLQLQFQFSIACICHNGMVKSFAAIPFRTSFLRWHTNYCNFHIKCKSDHTDPCIHEDFKTNPFQSNCYICNRR